MKVIFLDIDGVLNSKTDFLEAAHYGHPHNSGNIIISPGKLYLLESIIVRTGAKIVVSSSWRNTFKLSEIHEMFNSRGFTLPRTVIIGKTPNLRHGISSGPEYFRSKEIKEWLDGHINVDSYVILDDIPDRWFDTTLHDNLITTNEYDGLNFIQANQAVHILGMTEEAQKEYDEYTKTLILFI